MYQITMKGFHFPRSSFKGRRCHFLDCDTDFRGKGGDQAKGMGVTLHPNSQTTIGNLAVLINVYAFLVYF